jgi:hypothetical protein
VPSVIPSYCGTKIINWVRPGAFGKFFHLYGSTRSLFSLFDDAVSSSDYVALRYGQAATSIYTRGGQLPKLREPYLSSHFGQEPQAFGRPVVALQ